TPEKNLTEGREPGSLPRKTLTEGREPGSLPRKTSRMLERETAMRRRGALRAWVVMGGSVLLLAALPGCGSSDDPNGRSGSSGRPKDPTTAPTTTAEEQVQKILDARKTDYGEALRTASLKLRDRLPDLAEIKQIESAGDDAAKKPVYEKLVDDMLTSDDFSRTMIKFWRDTFRIGPAAIQNNVNKDAAPTFAAQLTVEGRSYSELFTANTNTCPTYGPATDGAPNTFNATSCALPTNGVAGPTVGILTDPGLQGQYFANMAFRRVRFIQ